MKTRWLLTLSFIIAISQAVLAQLTPGRIITPSTTTVMDPNGDGWVTKNGTQFTPNKGYWVDEFELPMFGIPKLGGDAIGDNIGQPCGITDLIPDRDGYSVYALRDANNNLIFRFRVGNNNPSVEAWTILLDVDGLFGSSDPDATGINPGFEIDITLIKRQNAGVFVYNINGKQNCPQPLLNFPISSNFQIAVGDEVSCGNLDYFYDFYVNFNTVAAAYNASANANIDVNTGLRYAAVTNVSATCAMDGNIADISGVNFQDYKNNIAAAFIGLIEAQCPTAVADLCGTCLGFNSGLPAKPTINEPIRAGQTFVSGTSQQDTYIKLSVYSIIPGTESSPQWQTTPREEHVVFVPVSAWTVTLNGPLQAYDRIVAKAQLNADGSGCGSASGNEASTSVTVVEPNVAPVASNQSVNVSEDTPTAITLQATDADGDVLAYSIVSLPAHGTLSCTNCSNPTYTPNANYFGPDSFTFRAYDGVLFSNTATVSINVLPVNDAPVANSQTLTTPEDTPLAITLTGSDIENDPLTYSVLTPPTNGTLTGTAPNLTYTPNANFNGSDSFTFIVNDGSANSNTATISITVTPVNDAPVASNLNITTAEDTPVSITLQGSDVENSPLTYTIVTPPQHGTLSGSGATRTYTPAVNYNGPDSFTYQVSDGLLTSNVATVSITVTPVNDAPVANSQSLTTPEDTPLGITLTGSDVDGDALTFSIVNQPQFGTLTGSGANYTYSPNTNFNGQDSFTFIVNDGTVNSSQATVFINVTPVPDSPIANSQSVVTNEDTPVAFTLTGSDPDGDNITFIIVTNPANGTLSGTLPNLTYTPNPNYNGPDSFTFKVNDGTNDSAPATVSITVNPVNDAPVASPQSVTVIEDTPKVITLVATDVDGNPLTYTIVTPPQNGTLSVITGADVTYTPNANYVGPDSFVFKANDGTTDSNNATVSINVTPVNDAPVANPQSVTVNEDNSIVINLTGSDVDGDALSFSIVTPPSNGTLSCNNCANPTYTPNLNYNGPDSFTFKVNDGTTDSAPATVSITVTPVNDAPVASTQSVTVIEDTPKVITLVATDVDGNSLTYTIVTPPQNGTLSVVTGADVTYTPNANYVGPDSFVFKANDGTTDSNNATVSINVTPVNDAPVANNQSVTVIEDTAKGITLTASDADGDVLTYSIVTPPTNGTLSAISGNQVTYTPNSNYNGSDSFTFRVNDGTVFSNTATVSITVTPVNDPPVVIDATIVYDLNTPVNFTLQAFDPDGDPLTYTLLTLPANGIISGTAPNLTYTPALNDNGNYTLTFKVNDGTVDSGIATVSINFNIAGNEPPVANNQSVTTNEDVSINITLSASDPDGDPLTYIIVSGPANGTLTATGNPAVYSYTPNANYNGADSFTFKVNDLTVDSNIATVSITVNPVNDAPVANAQTVVYTVNGSTPITLTGSDVDGDPITFTVLTQPANGTLSGSGNSYTYTPNTNYNGLDSFTFKVNDGQVDSQPATVSLTASTANNAPIANAQSVTTPEDMPLAISLTGFDVDGNPLTYSVVTNPTNGTLSCTNCANPTYTPNLNYNGSDSFTFKVNDGTIDSSPATVSITVTPVNDAPIANPQTVTVQEDTPKAITLTGSDVDGDAITFTVLTQPANGTLSGTVPNLTYTPNSNYVGPDSFTFRVSDGALNSTTATVSINVMPENDAPVANAQTLTTPEDTPLAITLTGSDVDGDALSFAVVTGPTNGTLSCTNCANPTYTPNLNYNGSDSFTFKVNDGTIDSSPATVSITVTSVNDAPIANNQTVSAQEDTPKGITLTGSDVDGDALTFIIVTQPTKGILSGTGANVTYTPNTDYAGPDSFTFKVNDGTVDSNIATVTINVTPVNDPPVAVDDVITTDEDVVKTFNITGNDTDIDGTIDPATVDLDPSTPAEEKTFTVTGEGVYTVDNAGNVTYTPALNYNGINTPVGYTVKDNSGALSNTAFIRVTVNPVNDAPVPQNATVTVNEDETTSICFTVTDVENDPSVFTGGVSLDGKGTLVLDPATGQYCFLYTPNQDNNDPDRVEVTVCDANDNTLCNTAIITININPVNDAPRIIVNNNPVDELIFTTQEDTPLPFCFDADDLENDNLSVGTFTNVTGGGSVVAGTITGNTFCFTFTPASNFTGRSTWKIQICDDGNPSLCKEVTIHIDITPVNDPPVAENQTVTVVEDTPKVITLTGTDPDGDPLTYTIVSNPTKGTLSGTGANRTYTPNLNYNGPDSFTFRVNDGTVDSNIATVSITVTPVNDAPRINPIPILTTPEDTGLQVCLGAEDIEGDALTYNAPVNISGGGTMTGSPGLVFCFDFMPAKDFNGTSIWRFTVCDNGTPSMCSEIIVTINVTPVNDAPVAVNDFITAQSFVKTEPVNILSNDRDVENDPLVLTVKQLAGPHFGTITMEANGTFTYKSILGYIGPDSVRYQVCDTPPAGQTALCDVGVVFIEVGPAPFKIYNGLSPNGDGLNDYWRIDGIESYPNNRVKIFDRFNNLVFETTGYNNEGNSWTGQINHGLMRGTVPDGSYYYALDLGDGSGLLSGYIVLKKN